MTKRPKTVSAQSLSGVDVDEIPRQAVDILFGQIKSTLLRYGVQFDDFFSERVNNLAARASAPTASTPESPPRRARNCVSDSTTGREACAGT